MEFGEGLNLQDVFKHRIGDPGAEPSESDRGETSDEESFPLLRRSNRNETVSAQLTHPWSVLTGLREAYASNEDEDSEVAPTRVVAVVCYKFHIVMLF